MFPSETKKRDAQEQTMFLPLTGLRRKLQVTVGACFLPAAEEASCCSQRQLHRKASMSTRDADTRKRRQSPVNTCARAGELSLSARDLRLWRRRRAPRARRRGGMQGARAQVGRMQVMP